MTYRDEGDASLLRREALERSLLQEEDLERREHIGAELAELDRSRRIAARKHLPLVARATIASPCHETFEAMHGEGAIRSCARCDREVFDLARMTLGQAEALIASRGGKACVRLRKRADGTLMFADCEVGARGVRAKRFGAVIAATVIASTALAIGSQPAWRVRRAFGMGRAPHAVVEHASYPPAERFIMGEMQAVPVPAPPPPAWQPAQPRLPDTDPLARVMRVLSPDPQPPVPAVPFSTLVPSLRGVTGS